MTGVKSALTSIALLLFLTVLLSAADGSDAADDSEQKDFMNGDGSFTNPWEISTAEQFMNIPQYVGKNSHFILIDDILIDSPVYKSKDGKKICDFEGVLEGQHHRITFKCSGFYNTYLFESVKKGSEIRNLNMTVDLNSEELAAGIVKENHGKIYNCRISGIIYVDNTYNFDSNSGNCYAGSIAISNYGIIEQCSSDANISIVADTDTFTGGISATSKGGFFKNCHVTGSLHSSSNGIYTPAFCGGITSLSTDGGAHVENCLVSAKIYSYSYSAYECSGLIGIIDTETEIDGLYGYKCEINESGDHDERIYHYRESSNRIVLNNSGFVGTIELCKIIYEWDDCWTLYSGSDIFPHIQKIESITDVHVLHGYYAHKELRESVPAVSDVKFDDGSVSNMYLILIKPVNEMTAYGTFEDIEIQQKVEACKPIALRLVKMPDTQLYSLGQNIDMKGSEFELVFQDGMVTDVTSEVTIAFDEYTSGKQTITANYQSYTTQFDVYFCNVYETGVLLHYMNKDPELITCMRGESVILPDYECEGYVFNGWNVSSPDGDRAYVENGAYMPVGNTELYADLEPEGKDWKSTIAIAIAAICIIAVLVHIVRKRM